MFDFISRNKRLAQIVMALIIIPFMFFGVDAYFRGAGVQGDLAKVGDARISAQAFETRLRDQQNQARTRLGEAYDPTMFNAPEVRFAVLNQMVTETLLQQKALDDHFRVSDQKVFDAINGIDAFRVDGKFSSDLYKQVLLQQNMTPAMFEQSVRSEFLVAPLVEPLQAAELSASSTAERYLLLTGEKREVALASLEVADFVKQVKVSDQDIEAYYTQNPQAFQSQETVSIDYVTLNRAMLFAQITVSATQLREAYERDKNRYAQPETRDAAHILITVAKDATNDQKTEARKKAEALMLKAKEAPASFASLAKDNSQDPGSAAQGGELGPVTMGGFERSFEDAVFNAKENGIVGPVETEYGYHIIKVVIHPARVPAFDDIKAKIENDIKQSEASKMYAEKAAEFMNLVHEQADSFNELSKKLDIPVSRAEFLTRAQVAQLANSHKGLVDAIFSSDSLRDRQNTEVIEIGANADAIMSARIVDHKPAALRPLEDVKAGIRKQLEDRMASDLTRQAGEEKLAQLQQGKTGREVELTFAKPVTLTRQQQQPGFPAGVQEAAFRAEAGKLPAYLGAVIGQSRYTIYRVEKIIVPEAMDSAQKTATMRSLSEMKGRETVNAYLKNLRDNTKVDINQEKLNAIQQAQ